ncbi:MAG TPA: hypothetical protein VJ385_19650 [Fibrobacteria bacterium]|nr:hypothetical protein [Fibrobacteria bacterium]
MFPTPAVEDDMVVLNPSCRDRNVCAPAPCAKARTSDKPNIPTDRFKRTTSFKPMRTTLSQPAEEASRSTAACNKSLQKFLKRPDKEAGRSAEADNTAPAFPE